MSIDIETSRRLAVEAIGEEAVTRLRGLGLLVVPFDPCDAVVGEIMVGTGCNHPHVAWEAFNCALNLYIARPDDNPDYVVSLGRVGSGEMTLAEWNGGASRPDAASTGASEAESSSPVTLAGEQELFDMFGVSLDYELRRAPSPEAARVALRTAMEELNRLHCLHTCFYRGSLVEDLVPLVRRALDGSLEREAAAGDAMPDALREETWRRLRDSVAAGGSDPGGCDVSERSGR